jgi:uncharacterized protein
VEFVTIPIEEAGGKEKFILFRPMKSIAFVGNRAMLNLVEALERGEAPEQPEAVQFLYGIGFLEPDPLPPAIGRPAFEPTSAVLLMTNQCQLRCVYCYAAAGENPKEELSFETARTVIDTVVKNAQKRQEKQFSISLHGGGEPVKAWKVLKECVTYARSQPLKADITLTSNGIWSRAQTEWIVANLNGISLSIDGGPETQDRQRPTLSGKGSSAIALRTVRELDRCNFNYGVRMTATAPWTSLAEDVRYLCENTHCQTIQVEPAFNTGRSGHAQPTVEEGQAFVHEVLKAYDVADAYQRKFYYAGARMGWVTDVFCAAPYNALIVTPGGDLMSCYEVTSREHPFADLSRIGRVENGEVRLNLEKRSELHRLIRERRAGCQDCICYWSCAGNCYTRAFEMGENGHLVYGGLCEITKTLVKELLLRKIAQGKGVWRMGDEAGQRQFAQVDASPKMATGVEVTSGLDGSAKVPTGEMMTSGLDGSR